MKSRRTKLIKLTPRPVFFGLPVLILVAWFALSPSVRAVLPPPDGGYPGFNTAEGEDALFSNTTGQENTAIGFHALYSNTEGYENTATGVNALFSNTIGVQNTATGFFALNSNTKGNDNVATGSFALQSNTSGYLNTATGTGALSDNTTGQENTATGAIALGSNITGKFNTANGSFALFRNFTGVDNTAIGARASSQNEEGSRNTATGSSALRFNLTGSGNAAYGYTALYNTTGSGNIALGDRAGVNLTTGDNNIDIGNPGLAGDSGRIRIGTSGKQTDTRIAGIYGTTLARGVQVIIGSQGKLGTTNSSRRFKDQIKPMEKASEALLKLEPVTFCYKEDLDPDAIPQFGLIAEEVEKVNPDLVVRDEDGEVMTVRYEAVNAMLLNEFLKEHRKVEEQGATIAQMEKQIEALTATVQKVSEQMVLSKPSPQLVTNP